MNRNRNKKGMKKRKTERKGFSLIELLAVLVIIGILSFFAVTGVTRYIRQSKEVKNEENVKNIKMAAQMYMQANRSSLPKNIGESIILDVRTLRDTNYLKEDITNSKGESCMQSNVRIYHYDRDEYSYYVRMACGDKPSPSETEGIPSPKIKLDLHNDNDKEITDTTAVRDIYFTSTIWGSDGSEEKYSDLGISSYSYEIYVGFLNDDEADTADESDVRYQLVESNQNIAGGLKHKIEIQSKKTSEYVDLSGYSVVKVIVSAVNEQGKSNQVVKFSQKLNDSVAPLCTKLEGKKYFEGEAENDNDWLNKEAYYQYLHSGVVESSYRTDSYETKCFKNANHSFTVMVNCDDGLGSGCVRDSFVRTWPNGDFSGEPDPETKQDTGVNYHFGARWATITIKDNADNSTNCFVRANVDLQAPTLKVTVYKVENYERYPLFTKEISNENIDDNGKGDTVSISCADEDDKDKACPGDLAVSSTGELWMNAANYKEGSLEVDVEMKDNLYLHDYTWELNSPYVGSKGKVGDATLDNARVEQGNSSIIRKVYSNNNADTYLNQEEKRPGNLKDSNVEVSTVREIVQGLKINREGKRYAKFTACDKAGNCTTVKLYFNIDVTAPPIPNPQYLKNKSKTGYDPADKTNYMRDESNHWSNEAVMAYIPKSYARDNETKTNQKAELSGFDHFNYYYAQQSGRNGIYYSWKTAPEKKLSNAGSGNYQYNFVISDQGTHKISFTSCDKAGNCTKKPVDDDYVRVDTYAPTCSTRKEPNDSSWHNSPVTVYGDCTESTKISSAFASGCARYEDGSTSIHHQYFMDMNSSYAGPADLNNKGYIQDYAGNKANCDYKTVKIDTLNPTCSHGSYCSRYYYETYCPPYGYCRTRKVCDTMTFWLSCSDGKRNGVSSGCTSPSYVSKNFSAYSDNGYSFNTVFKDSAGNSVDCKHYESSDETAIDSGPTFSCSIDSTSGVITVSNPKSVSGIADTQYKVVGTSSGHNYSYQRNSAVLQGFSCTQSDTYTAYVKITNNLGTSKEMKCLNTYAVKGCCDGNVTYRDGACSASCGGGTQVREAYSAVDGSRCPGKDQTVSCNTQACQMTVNDCNYRGQTLMNTPFSWDCSSGHVGHYKGYFRYCKDPSTGVYYNRLERSEMMPGVAWDWTLVCPDCGANGCRWTPIPDGGHKHY